MQDMLRDVDVDGYRFKGGPGRGAPWRALSGPYDSHAEALARVREDREWAETVDPRACWYAYGTMAMPRGSGVSVLRVLVTLREGQGEGE